MRHRLGTALACSLLVLVTGCGQGDSGSSSRQSDPPAVEPSVTDSPTPTPTPTPAPTKQTTPPSDGLQKTRVVGQVAQIGDCTVVRDDNDTTWTITGPQVAELVLHDRVQVTGTPNIAAMGCGGPVLEATRVTVLPPVE